jgi:dephospho-CoA kinase
MSERIWRIGLTGGIGSGKSTVAGFLAKRGAFVIDADAISRQLTAPQGLAMPAIVTSFGPQMQAPDGSMDRQAMRALVFQDPQAKQVLENIIHPLVSLTLDAQAQTAALQGHRVLVFDVPLLVESGARWRKQLDRVWVVDCDAQTQRHRVQLRSGLSPEDADRIMAQQATRAQRLACADLVILNQHLSFDELDHLVGLAATDFGL